jgi:hypothetical protein
MPIPTLTNVWPTIITTSKMASTFFKLSANVIVSNQSTKKGLREYKIKVFREKLLYLANTNYLSFSIKSYEESTKRSTEQSHCPGNTAGRRKQQPILCYPGRNDCSPTWPMLKRHMRANRRAGFYKAGE